MSRKHDLFGHLIMRNSNIRYSIPACAILSHPRTYLSKRKHRYDMAIGFYYVSIPKPWTSAILNHSQCQNMDDGVVANINHLWHKMTFFDPPYISWFRVFPISWNILWVSRGPQSSKKVCHTGGEFSKSYKLLGITVFKYISTLYIKAFS